VVVASVSRAEGRAFKYPPGRGKLGLRTKLSYFHDLICIIDAGGTLLANTLHNDICNDKALYIHSYKEDGYVHTCHSGSGMYLGI
jgi:hypothetical protein